MTRATRILRLTVSAAALASSAALAQEIQNTAAYTSPENSVSIGAGASTGDHRDRTRFGLFNGLREDDGNLLLDFNVSSKNLDSGRWMIFEGRNIGLDNRELGFTWRNLGDFKLKVDYGEITRHDPRVVNTYLQGAGTTTPTVLANVTATNQLPGGGQELNLELKRKGIGFELQKQFGNYQVEVSFKNEDKKGARQWGIGFACSAGSATRPSYTVAGVCTGGSATTVLFLPEPVDSTIRQIDAKFNYNGSRLKLTGGYYGNLYTNDNGSLRATVSGGTFGNLNPTAAGAGTVAVDALLRTQFLQQPIALWPDSQAHQLFLGGNYALTSHTKMNFKLSYTRATQNENFGAMGLTNAPAGRSDLGGRLDTTRAQVGVSSHPTPKLHLTGDVMYEHKSNKTPVAVYNIQQLTNVVGGTGTWTNSAMSPSKFEAKAQATYKLPYQLLGVVGANYEHENFGVWTPTDAAGGINGLRQKVETTGYRVELRKTMSETFTGSVGYHSDRRKGDSPWLKPRSLPLTGVFPADENCVSVGTNACIYTAGGEFAFSQMNRQRDKVRAIGNWTPMQRLSLQAVLDLGDDRYRGPTTSGLESTDMYDLSLDAEYQLTDNWKLRAFVTGNRRSYNMQRTGDFELDLRDRSTTFGAGFAGTPIGTFKVGGDLLAMRDVLRYGLTSQSAATTTVLNASGGLPDVKYTLLRFNLYGEYALNKASSIRLDYIYHRTFFNEWTYDGLNNGLPFVFSDNTTITAQQRQSVSFLGVRYVHRFQ